VWAKTGQRTFYNISVEHNLGPIRKLLQETFPGENIVLQSARDSVTLAGRVSSQNVADRSAALVASLAKSVVNNLNVAPTPVDKQILLKVKFAEVNRTTAESFGVNLLSTGALNTPAGITTGQFSPPSASNVSGAIPGGLQGAATRWNLTDALNVFAFRPDLNLAATVRALQSEGVLQILAEPNLVTSNGKPASFLVGGEFPVPVLQGGSNAGAVTIQFREFGIRLSFSPEITAHQTLKMHVKPEVSTIDLANAVTFSGFTIPALATRRMETDIELGAGQSFVIGGLIDDRVQDSMNKIPGLSNIPLLGVLFKSRQDRKTKTELIVMVTPEIVDPLNAADPKPIPVMPRNILPPTQAPKAKPARGKGTTASRKNTGKEAKTESAETAAASEPAAPPASEAEQRAVARLDLEQPAMEAAPALPAAEPASPAAAPKPADVPVTPSGADLQ
jgi:pilus assembly protein CpaC